jgi:hypothetical protein
MKRILAVMVFFAAATSLALGQTADKQEKTKGEKADVEQILLQMERDGNEATVKKDVATLSELLADDWIGQSPAPQTAQLIPKTVTVACESALK